MLPDTFDPGLTPRDGAGAAVMMTPGMADNESNDTLPFGSNGDPLSDIKPRTKSKVRVIEQPSFILPAQFASGLTPSDAVDPEAPSKFQFDTDTNTISPCKGIETQTGVSESAMTLNLKDELGSMSCGSFDEVTSEFSPIEQGDDIKGFEFSSPIKTIAKRSKSIDQMDTEFSSIRIQKTQTRCQQIENLSDDDMGRLDADDDEDGFLNSMEQMSDSQFFGKQDTEDRSIQTKPVVIFKEQDIPRIRFNGKLLADCDEETLSRSAINLNHFDLHRGTKSSFRLNKVDRANTS